MTGWFRSLLEEVNDLKDASRDWLDGSLPVFIYGAGTFAKDVFRALTQRGVHVSAFLDHRETSPEFLNGMPVLRPESARGAVVVMGVHNRSADVFEITRRLNECGARHVISPVDIFNLFGDLLGERYWLANSEFYFPRKAFIEKCYLLLKDDSSRSLYSKIIRFRLTGDYSALPVPDFENQYFSPDIPEWKKPLRLVDCGAFDGDTLSSFINAGITIESIAAFEPDNANFSRLSRFVSAHTREIPNAVLFPCGVSLSTTHLRFESGQGEASVFSSAGGILVQCVALDDVIPAFAPNLIKMDIEGAECDALMGARRIINAHLPGLAISLYHRPEHLWEIPLLVEDIAYGKYDFYIRSHAMSSFDTVLYCVPKSSPNKQ